MSSAGNSKEIPNTKIYSNLESASYKFYREINSERCAIEESTRGTIRGKIHKIANCDHEIDKDGLHKSNTKTDAVSAVSEAPRPENVTQLRSFLGLMNYIITVFYKPVSSDWTIK